MSKFQMFNKIIAAFTQTLGLAAENPVPETTTPQNTMLQNIWIESFKNTSFSLLNANLKTMGYTEPSSLSDFAFLFNEFIGTMSDSLREFFARVLYVTKPSTVIPARLMDKFVLLQVYFFGKKLRALEMNMESYSPDNCCLLDKRVISAETAQLMLNGHLEDRVGVPVICIYMDQTAVSAFKLEKLNLCLRCIERQLMLPLDEGAVINNAAALSDVPVDEVYISRLLERRDGPACIKTSNYEIKTWFFLLICGFLLVYFVEFLLVWIGTGMLVSLKRRILSLENSSAA